MRRRWLRAGVAGSIGALAGLPVSGCSPAAGEQDWRRISGGFPGADLERGHILRSTAQTAPKGAGQRTQKTRVAVVGAGVAGLSAARILSAAGIDDYRIFELDSTVGGNSRAGSLGGLRCPWGAHYLPTPSLSPVNEFERDLLAMLREFGLVIDGAAGPQFLETALCHAPQERVLFNGRWQSGLLPVEGVPAQALAQYRRFSELVAGEKAAGGFDLPAALPTPAQVSRDQIRFDRWLDDHGLADPHLRWYLDYCCRDDFGASSAEVSAWAGLHYFASRHGFEYHEDPSVERRLESPVEVLTWPEGNEWLVERMARPHRPRTQLDAIVRRVQTRLGAGNGSDIDVWHPREGRSESWHAEFVILAIPLNVAARILDPVPPALQSLLPRLQYAAWQVANVLLSRSPAELPGAPLSWDNVVYGSDWLGYVDAGHQLLQAHRGAALFTSYRALGTDRVIRNRLLTQTWRQQAAGVIENFKLAYPDIGRLVQAVDVVRWGHAMLLPAPGLRSDPAFAALRRHEGPVLFAHSDRAGYSVFEEAFVAGTSAARHAVRAMLGRR